jgi:hypothetical protein
MDNFTDLLDEYLSTKRALEQLREGFTGYGFSDVFYREVERHEKAKDALNLYVSRFAVGCGE